MIAIWLTGLFRARTATIVATIAGVALTVGLIVALGGFMRSSAASMMARAVGNLPIDWQVQLASGNEREPVLADMRMAARIAKSDIVGYATVEGLESSTGGTVQVTGAAKVLGVEAGYAADFPSVIRPLLGGDSGVLIAQQTAANLHVGPGEVVLVRRPGLPAAPVTIDGVVDLPNADGLFQTIGASAGAAPAAPPDNVVLLPLDQWHVLFDPQAALHPDSIRFQLQAKLDTAGLPDDPTAALASALSQGHNFEARVAGHAVLANNLAAALGAVREDALYARVVFLLLGAPGAAIAAILTIALGQSGGQRRRRDQAWLRLRGATTATLLSIALAEALAVGIAGCVGGALIGLGGAQLLFSRTLSPATDIGWIASAAFIGLLLPVVAVMGPAWRDARVVSVARARAGLVEGRHWVRIAAFAEAALLLLGLVIFGVTAQTGYQVVLAPEGVAAASVDYWAFLAPLFLWLGMGLLALRLTHLVLTRGQRQLSWLARPISGGLSPLIGSALAHQPTRIAGGVALTALTLAFATSTSIFNATYKAQARVDAELTNGADVTVTGSSAAPASLAYERLAALSTVAGAAQLQHRLAYVGTDLQDLYGIDPLTIGRATSMSNAFFGNGNAEASLAALRNAPDGVLVSEETVSDFQLQPGDTINLRLERATDHEYHVFPFRFVGTVREFPTAPRDSFLVANASFVAWVTANAGAETVLLKASGDLAAAHAAAANIAKDIPGAAVRDLTEAQKLIGSSLTAIDLDALTQLELAYAVVLTAAAAGLVFALGVLDRRRSFAILAALGAKPTQLRVFLRSEALVVLSGGTALGLVTGTGVAWMMVKLLTGVFDPPPETIAFPWGYVLFALTASAIAIASAVYVASRQSALSPHSLLRQVT